MAKIQTAAPRFANDQSRTDYLATNRIAVGAGSNPEEFQRELARFGKLLPNRRPLRVLDIGCGTGAWSVHWVALGCLVTGVDLDPEFIARAQLRQRLAKTGAFRGMVGDASQLPLGIGKFDVVSLNSLLEHVDDWRAVVNEAVRVLAPGGILLLHTTNRHHPFQGEINNFPFYPWLPQRLREQVLAWIMKHRRDLVNYTDYPAVHWFTYTQLSSVLRSLGLEVYDRLDLMQPEQMKGARSILRWMAPGKGRGARAKSLYYLASPTVSLYARNPERDPSQSPA